MVKLVFNTYNEESNKFKTKNVCLMQYAFLYKTDHSHPVFMSNVSRLLNGLVKKYFFCIKKKVQAGNDQEKAKSKRNSHSKNRGGKDQIDN